MMTLRDRPVLISMTVDVLAVVDERQVVLVQGVQDQLDADEGQDRRQAVGEVDQAVQQSVDQEVQLAQAHQRERRGGEDDEDVLGQAEDGRDRVQGEQDVRAADGHHDQQHRGQDLLAVLHVNSLSPS